MNDNSHAWFECFSSSLMKQQSTGRHVAPLGHIILISSPLSLLFLLNAACVEEKHQNPIV